MVHFKTHSPFLSLLNPHGSFEFWEQLPLGFYQAIYRDDGEEGLEELTTIRLAKRFHAAGLKALKNTPLTLLFTPSRFPLPLLA